MQENSMDIADFIKNYQNYPVLFIGTGFSLRYLNNSCTWDNLLKKISLEIYDSEEKYYDIKAKYIGKDKQCNYAEIATEIEKDFNLKASEKRDGKFKIINDTYYENLKTNTKISKFKIYISNLFKDLDIRDSEETNQELESLEKAKKNVSSIITTNYDQLIEKIFNFSPLIGNDIVLKNPYGSVYKIHGCVTDPNNIIITASDYNNFDKKYEFIKAQLLSIFIHNPIIFIGYSISDENIKNLLKTIFSNIPANSDISKKIRNNFLLIEHERGKSSREVIEHDIDLLIDGVSTIVRINKIKTDQYSIIYDEIANLTLPISAMDIKKVQNILKKITNGDASELIVQFANDIDDTNNSDMVVAIGTKDSITVKDEKITDYANSSDLLLKYFQIVDNNNKDLVKGLNKLTIQSSEYFPIFGFEKIGYDLKKVEDYKNYQRKNLQAFLNKIKPKLTEKKYTDIYKIINDTNIPKTHKHPILFWNIFKGNISLQKTKNYLIKINNEANTEYRRILCLYDYLKNNKIPLTYETK